MKNEPTGSSPLPGIIAFLVLLVPYVLITLGKDFGVRPIVALFSGWAFSNRQLVVGGALDQPSLQKGLFGLCASLVLICPILELVCRLASGCGRGIRLGFAAAMIPLFVHVFSVLTLFLVDVSRYVYHMGFTQKRLAGLSIGVLVFCGLALLIVRVWRFTRTTADSEVIAGTSPSLDHRPLEDQPGPH